jgi:hypothetical protein
MFITNDLTEQLTKLHEFRRRVQLTNNSFPHNNSSFRAEVGNTPDYGWGKSAKKGNPFSSCASFADVGLLPGTFPNAAQLQTVPNSSQQTNPAPRAAPKKRMLDPENTQVTKHLANVSDGPPQKKKARQNRSNLAKSAVAILKNWMFSPEHFHHPYPSEQEKQHLAESAKITKKQVCNWFTNARKRLWQPATGLLPQRVSSPTAKIAKLAYALDMTRGSMSANPASTAGWGAAPAAFPLSFPDAFSLSVPVPVPPAPHIVSGGPLQLRPVYRQPESNLEWQIQQALQANPSLPQACQTMPANIQADDQAAGALLGLSQLGALIASQRLERRA